jgi:hypothetical protein
MPFEETIRVFDLCNINERGLRKNMALEQFLEKRKGLLRKFDVEAHSVDQDSMICQEKLRSFEEFNHFVFIFC